MNTLQQIPNFIVMACFLVLVGGMFYTHMSQRRRLRRQAQLLWETGATVFLGKVWGMNVLFNNTPLGSKIDRSLIRRHIAASIQEDKTFLGDVCGETIEGKLFHPNTLLVYVERQETETALRQAYASIYTYESQVDFGLCPLQLDIRVTG